MIDLTPLDVRKKRGDFKKLMRGYDPHEVDTFLELAAERLEVVVRENLQLQQRVQTLQSQVDAQLDRERAVQDALVTAQELRSDIQAQSQREADHVLREADAEARRLLAEAKAEARRVLSEAEAEVRDRLRDVERRHDQAQDAVLQLEHRRIRFLRDFRNLLERELDMVGSEETKAATAQGGAPTAGATGPLPPPASLSALQAHGLEVEAGAREPVAEAEGKDERGEVHAAGWDEAESDDRVEPSSGDLPGSEAAADQPVVDAEAVGAGEVDPVEALRSQQPEAGEPPTVDVTVLQPSPPSASPPQPSTSPVAPPPSVPDVPSALEVELMAGASHQGEASDKLPGTGGAETELKDLETLLAEARGDRPPEQEDISPPPAPGQQGGRFILLDREETDR
jgi:cell division initiation protein